MISKDVTSDTSPDPSDETLPVHGKSASGKRKPPGSNPRSAARSSSRSKSGLTVWDEPIKEGMWIGPYRLIGKFGEGGMGTVYLAEQREPITRRVALKIIKAGMDTKEVISRFEAERQALALMDHPNIARVLDAGTTESGRPYFVMELVIGMPITEYCDNRKLGVRERLDLFVAVCQGIQHAHQKGIVHRDIKPNNVLIAVQDDQPVPKVIDFGIAKAIGQGLTEQTLYTVAGQLIGTLQYMSPEQLESRGYDIDTRSDVYSLGILLYELLTGRAPIEVNSRDDRGLEETLRTLRETDPPRPSSKLETLAGESLQAVADVRGAPPAKLTQLLRGDLDWIVLKALEKDRTRRYETPNGLLMDIRRFLADEPVTASPPTVGYLCRKYASRHRGPLIAAGVIVVILLSGVVASTWQALRATRAEKLAGQRLVEVEEERTLAVNAEKAAVEARDEAERQKEAAVEAKENADQASLRTLEALAKAGAAEKLAQQRLEEAVRQEKEAVAAKEQAERLYTQLKEEVDRREQSEKGRKTAEMDAATERERVRSILAFLRSEEMRRELMKSDPDGLQIIQTIDWRIGDLFKEATSDFVEEDYRLSREFGDAALTNLDLELESAVSNYAKAIRLADQRSPEDVSEGEKNAEKAWLMVKMAEAERLMGHGDACLEYLDRARIEIGDHEDATHLAGHVKSRIELELALLHEFTGRESEAAAAARAGIRTLEAAAPDGTEESGTRPDALRLWSVLARNGEPELSEEIRVGLEKAMAGLSGDESGGELPSEVAVAHAEARIALARLENLGLRDSGVPSSSTLSGATGSDVELGEGGVPNSREALVSTLQWWEKEVASRPGEREPPLVLLDGYFLLGEIEQRGGQAFEALRSFERCRSIANDLLKRDDDFALPRDRVIRASHAESVIYGGAGESGRRLESLNRCHDYLIEAEERGISLGRYRESFPHLKRELAEATVHRFYVVSGSRGTLEENTFYADEVEYLVFCAISSLK